MARTQLAELAIEIARLSRENVELREAVTARDRFLAVATPELRNPMTPIRNWLVTPMEPCDIVLHVRERLFGG
jgi:hypothetical protein